MNEQPAEYVSQFIAFVFILIGIGSFLFKKPKTTRTNFDYFELGYVSEDIVPIHSYIKNSVPCNQQKKQATKVVKHKTTKQKIKYKPAKQPLSPLKQDCVMALRGMGMTKSEAIEKAHYIFKSTQPKTIQEFIMEAFKRERY